MLYVRRYDCIIRAHAVKIINTAVFEIFLTLWVSSLPSSTNGDALQQRYSLLEAAWPEVCSPASWQAGSTSSSSAAQNS